MAENGMCRQSVFRDGETLEHEESKDVQESYHALPALLALVTKLMNETMLTIGAEKGSERSLI
ncbi:MAG: hypothetical protein IKN64_04910 [Desulfovibrio sp.]|nr:hypothetical protein [Desulfovibrio sp.]